MKKLLSGNEALARGALEARIEIACGYPGTPSSEILENVSKYKEIYSEWSVNEKVAMDAAAGAAYSGRRALVTTKQVGMNVMSDSLFYTAYTGAEAALVVVTADDPGLFSSQNEQDNRHYAKLGKFPMLEPCDSQECKDFMIEAVDMSERFDTPVVIRTTMRTSHSKSVVELGAPGSYGREVGPFPRNIEKYNSMCTWARKRHYILEQRLLDIEEWSNTWPGNRIEWGDREYGFIAGGIIYEYVKQVFPEASILKLGMCYPLPKKLIREFADGVRNVIVVEELDPFIEEQVRAMGIPAHGKDIFSICGELLPEGCGAGVVAQTRDEGHVAAQACGRDGLVGPFAAVGLHEARLADGLARAGQVFDAGNHVDVGTAYYQNLVHVRLSLVNFCRFFALRGPDAAQSRGDAVFRFSGRPPIVPDAVSCRFAPVVFIGCLCRIRFLWGLWQMFGFRMLSF